MKDIYYDRLYIFSTEIEKHPSSHNLEDLSEEPTDGAGLARFTMCPPTLLLLSGSENYKCININFTLSV